MWVNYNGRFYPDAEVPIAANDLAWQYGLSFFETMRWTRGKLPLLEGHFRRLTAGLKRLHVTSPDFFTFSFLREEIRKTIAENGVSGDARVRLQAGPAVAIDGRLDGIHYKIECFPCEKLFFNEAGLDVGITKEPFIPNLPPLAAFKTGNYMPYFLASLEAKRRGLEEVFLLNNGKRIGEASGSNVFWTQNGQLFTPPLSEGIVAGVGRSRLIEVLSQAKETVQEQPLTLQCLQQADAVYLTNAFRGLRWIRSCEGMEYYSGMAAVLFQKAFAILT